jgi:hypothetical protein
VCASGQRFGTHTGPGWGGLNGSVASFVFSFAPCRLRLFSPARVFITSNLDRNNLRDLEGFTRFEFPTIGHIYDGAGQPLKEEGSP